VSKRIITAILFVLCIQPLFLHSHALSYKLNGGRLGDHIYSFCLAKWLAYKHGIDFYYVPFESSDVFSIKKYEKLLTKKRKKKFKKIIRIRTEEDLVYQLKTVRENTLFLVEFLAKICARQGIKKTDPLMKGTVAANWLFLFMKQNPQFEAAIKRDLKLQQNFHDIDAPREMITIAVHVRKGGGFDAPLISCQYIDQEFVDVGLQQRDNSHNDQADRKHPLKFPPEQYYVEQLIKIADMLNDRPIWVCIFTDDQDPEGLVKRFEQRINRSNVKLVAAHNGHNIFQKNMLEDVYQMACFDCLVKPASHFSWIAQLIGRHRMIVYPQWVEWNDAKNMNTITKVGAFLNTGLENGFIYIPFNDVSQDIKKIVINCLMLSCPFTS
jgi:hypothetical protein